MIEKEEKIELTFAEKHPKINTLLSILVIIVILAGILLCGKYILNYLILFGQWIINALGKTDAVIIVALITGGVTIITTSVSRYFEFRQSRIANLTQKREEPYHRFIDMVYKIQQNGSDNKYTNEEMIADLTSFSKDITLWGSKRVVNKWIEFRMASVKGKKAEENLFVLEEIMNEMRKDLGIGKTHKGRLLAFFVNDIEKYL